MRRWWFWMLVGLGLVYLAARSLASTYVIATMTARPMDLVRGEARIAVWLPETVTEPQPAGTARMGIGTGAFLGVRMSYELPNGGQASCVHSPFGVSCGDGWRMEFPTTPN